MRICDSSSSSENSITSGGDRPRAIQKKEHRLYKLRDKALKILNGAKLVSEKKDSTDESTILNNNDQGKIGILQEGAVIDQSLSMPGTDNIRDGATNNDSGKIGKKLTDDASKNRQRHSAYTGMSVLPVVMEEDDIHGDTEERRFDDMLSSSSCDSVNKLLMDSIEDPNSDTSDTPQTQSMSSSWDSYSFSSGGSRSHANKRRRKKKRSHGSNSLSSSSSASNTISTSRGRSTRQRMEDELHARLNAILILKEVVLKQHDSINNLVKENNKLKAKARVSMKSANRLHALRDDDKHHMTRLENEVKTLKVQLEESLKRIGGMNVATTPNDATHLSVYSSEYKKKKVVIEIKDDLPKKSFLQFFSKHRRKYEKPTRMETESSEPSLRLEQKKVPTLHTSPPTKHTSEKTKRLPTLENKPTPYLQFSPLDIIKSFSDLKQMEDGFDSLSSDDDDSCS